MNPNLIQYTHVVTPNTMLANTSSQDGVNSTWIPNSGASFHVTGSHKIYINLVILDRIKVLLEIVKVWLFMDPVLPPFCLLLIRYLFQIK